MKVYELSLNSRLQQVNEAVEQRRVIKGKAQTSQKEISFTDVLKKKVEESVGLKFSAHALRRLEEREVELRPAHIERLREGIRRAEEKGAKSSLILMDNRAFIVSVKNRVVVTVLNEERVKGNVFTNIDSVAIV